MLLTEITQAGAGKAGHRQTGGLSPGDTLKTNARASVPPAPPKVYGVDEVVRALVTDANGNLYASGCFTQAGGIAAKRVAKWNGTTWSALSSNAVCIDNLVITGAHGLYGDDNQWNGKAWTPLNIGLGIVKSLATDSSGNLYAGGSFSAPQVGVRKWDGKTWSDLRSNSPNGSMPLQIAAIAVDSKGILCAAGSFKTPNGRAMAVAKWNGSDWMLVGDAFEGVEFRDMVLDGKDNIYAAGSFSKAGSLDATGIAKWNGTQWVALGTGLPVEPNVVTVGYINALALDNQGTLYAGGGFGLGGENITQSVVKWTGTAWVRLGGKADNSVYALAADKKGNLYAGGHFKSIGGLVTNYIAKWNGTAWSGLANSSPTPTAAPAKPRIPNKK